MPGKKKKSRDKSRSSLTPREVPQNQIVYNGPIRSRVDSLQEDCHTVVMVYSSGAVVSSVGGTDATVLGNSPSNAISWAGFAAVFDEYRVLGIEAVYIPLNPYLANHGVTCSVVDHSLSTPLTSINDGAKYESFRLHDATKQWSRKAYMCETSDADFIATSGPANTFYIKTYTSSAAISTALFEFVLYYRVQFRGKGT